MGTQDTPPLTDAGLDILEELWGSDPDWAKDSLLVLRELRRLRPLAYRCEAHEDDVAGCPCCAEGEVDRLRELIRGRVIHGYMLSVEQIQQQVDDGKLDHNPHLKELLLWELKARALLGVPKEGAWG